MATTSTQHTCVDLTSTDGKFRRTDAGFRSIISEDNLDFPPEAGRYHLYISHACPWANRCNATRILKGLEDIIGLTVVHPTWQRTRPDDPEDVHCGWAICSSEDGSLLPSSGHGSVSNAGTSPDPVNSAKTVRELYEIAGDTTCTRSVPVLWDSQRQTIVNNESSEIMRMFNGPFARLAGTDKSTVDLYPDHLRKAIDDANKWIYPTINNGVYRCGFAKSQLAYEEAVGELTASLDRLEQLLSTQRYVASNEQITEADVRLFMTLIRYDEVYVVYFKTNSRSIRDYHHIRNYMRELYQINWLQSTTNMEHIKTHYFTSHPVLNPYSVVPIGPDVITDLLEPHDRK